LPFLLFSQIGIAADLLDVLARSDMLERIVIFWQQLCVYFQLGHLHSFEHLLQVVDDKTVLKTGAFLERLGPFFDSSLLVRQHQVGLPHAEGFEVFLFYGEGGRGREGGSEVRE
jgi:hypothetical protein